MTTPTLNLGEILDACASPEEAARVLADVQATLHDFAQAASESANEVDSAWQDKSAGTPWRRLSRIADTNARTLGRGIAAFGRDFLR